MHLMVSYYDLPLTNGRHHHLSSLMITYENNRCFAKFLFKEIMRSQRNKSNCTIFGIWYYFFIIGTFSSIVSSVLHITRVSTVDFVSICSSLICVHTCANKVFLIGLILPWLPENSYLSLLVISLLFGQVCT